MKNSRIKYQNFKSKYKEQKIYLKSKFNITHKFKFNYRNHKGKANSTLKNHLKSKDKIKS